MKSSITIQRTLPVWKRRAAWLALIPAAAILCLAAMPLAQSGEANTGSNEARLEGSWRVTATFDDGTPPLESPVSFTADGVMIGSQASSVDNLFTPWHGAWTKTGRREFVFTAICLYWDNTLSQVWKCILKETVMIEPDGDTYNGQASGAEYDPNGELRWGTFTATTHGVRIKAK